MIRASPKKGTMRHPLQDITVVAVEQAVAAPFATRQLADLGARVIKVERPEAGDFARGYDRTVHGQSSYFVWLNRGKESVELNLKDHGTPEEFTRHPQLRARDRWRRVLTPGGDIEALLPPVQVAGQEPVMGPVPALGEHTEAVRAELGISSPNGLPS
jgi:crotonobetainyl-CoA:carnitine CoA-transferase CaiB-like acyl-CoA transferase